jgi:hypothetical protein
MSHAGPMRVPGVSANPVALRPHSGLRSVLGEAAWHRLPAPVRVRFGEPAHTVDYVGEFEVVRASRLGGLLARLCQVIGTPVVPRTGLHVPAIVRVAPTGEGVAWHREYRWPNSAACLVRSTKMIDSDGTLVERLPARLCMPLEVYERSGTLHFVSRGYYFELGTRRDGTRIKFALPAWLSPGTTHVEHLDEADGWFRFTMTVTHPLLGELFYQTGRFRAARELT